MTPLVTARAVAFGYGGRFRLEGVSFELAAGELLGVIGPNASGKTTLVRLLSKVHAPQSGELRYAGRPLGRIPRRQLAREVAVLPQETAVAFPLTVEELCAMGRYPHAEGRFFDTAEDRARVHEAMRLAGVLELADAPVETLSGGERQRAALARALAQEPRVLLLDEPTSHLDIRHQREIVGLLRRLNRDRGTAIVLVSHDLNLAGEVADRMLLLAGGRVVRLGAPSEVLEEGTLEAAYGCPVRVEKNPVSGRPVVSVRWPDGD